MNMMIVQNVLNVQLSFRLQESGLLKITCIICISAPTAEQKWIWRNQNDTKKIYKADYEPRGTEK